MPTSILTLEIELRDVEPRVWRRIEVPSTLSFFDLHSTIMDAMGWRDTHLHEFTIGSPGDRASLRIGIPDDEFPDEGVEAGWSVPISRHVAPGRSIDYIYDPGDGWEHRITCLAEAPASPATRYPRCIAGARACPPEDVGGPAGYLDFLAATGDPAHEEHDAMLEWIGGEWDAEHFDPQAVRFVDPRRRLHRWRA
jgi:Fe-S-cluster formation regulator IscX/YfhJ